MSISSLESVADSNQLDTNKSLLPMHLLFLAMAIAFIFLGSLLQHWNFKVGILATEFGMLVLPAAVFMKIKGLSIKEQFKFNQPRPMDLLKVIVAGLCFVPLVGLANSLINLWLVYGFGITPPQIPLEEGAVGPLITFLIAALTPGFCEEFFFRGMLLTEYEKRMGSFQAAFITALLFGLFHYNIMNLLGPIVLGLIFAWVMQVTGSIFTAMLGHMVNNSVAVVMLYATAGYDQSKNMEAMMAFGNNWLLIVLMTMVMLIIIALPLGLGGIALLKSIRRHHLKPQDELSIGARNFQVHSVQGQEIKLIEISDQVHPQPMDDEGALKEATIIETTYERLLKNRGVRVTNSHWELSSFNGPFKFKVWWPVYLSVVIYVVLNIITIKTMIN